MARSAEHERPAADFTLSPFLKKVEKSMPKGMPKVILFDEKTVLGRRRSAFVSKNMTFELPFGIDFFSTFFENGESVKSAAGRSCSAERHGRV